MTRCANCRNQFTKLRMTMKVCGAECGEIYGRKLALEKAEKQKRKEAKAERLSYRQRKEALKTRGDYIKETQIVFNAFIRERDKDQLCICCDKPLGFGDVGGRFDAGHYRSVGSAPHLRFDERNCHGQRKVCNRYGSGRAVDYRLGLIRRIGSEEVESLEADSKPRHYSIEDLKGIKVCFREKLKELKSG